MKFKFRSTLRMLSLVALTSTAHGATWEESDGRYFENGDLAKVKRILAKEKYSGERLVEAFLTSVRSGNIDLVRYLEQRGWGKICRSRKDCDPTLYSVISRPHPKMLAYLLSRGYSPTRAALSRASAQVTPDDEDLSAGFESVRLLCDHGANPEEREKRTVAAGPRGGSSVVEELERRIAEPRMDLGTPLRHARGIAGEALVAEIFKSGLCKRGLESPAPFERFRALVAGMRRGAIDEQLSAILDSTQLRSQVETYLLYEAVAGGNADVLEDLRRRNWFERCRENRACRPVDIAAEAGANLATFQTLVAEGFDSVGRNGSGGTPLMYATLNARVDAAKYLCQQGADFRTHVKLEVYDRSIISILRRSYSDSWFAAARAGATNKSDRGRIMSRFGGDEGGDGGPPSAIANPECVPGATCMSIPFPPNGGEAVVRKLKALAEIFHFFNDGLCVSDRVAPQCASDTTRHAAVIGRFVNVRAESSMAGEKLATLPFGTTVEVHDRSPTCEMLSARMGRWIKVRVMPNQGQQEVLGWLFDSYVDYFPSFEP